MRLRAVLVVGLLAATGCGSRTGDRPDSGIEGRTLAGPTCPVEVRGSPCPDRPVSARVRVETPGGDEVLVFESGEDGSFRVPLEPGSYRLVPLAQQGLLFGKPVGVVVLASAFAHVDVLFDTGIR